MVPHLLVGLALLSTQCLASNDTLLPFSLEDFLEGVFTADSFEGTWISDTELRYVDSTVNDTVLFNATSNSSSVLISSDVLSSFSGGAFYAFSDSSKFVLISYDKKKVYRHSTTARFVVFDIEKETYTEVGSSARLQLAAWAGSTTGLLWVEGNNLYYRPNATDTSLDIQITSTGVSKIYFNAVPDWVYEEEVLSSASAMWSSSDGSLLAFAVFDDDYVRKASYFEYGEPGANDTQYPTVVNVSYPKVGNSNPIVYLKVVNLTAIAASNGTNLTSVDMQAPEAVTKDHIMYGCFWSGNTLVVSWTNRTQNLNIFTKCDVKTGNCTEVYRIQSDDAWVDPPTLVLSSDATRAASVLPHGDRFQLGVITFATESSNASVQYLTQGEITVQSVLGWDEDRGQIYYTSTVPGNPAMQQAYRVALSSTPSDPECLTCVMVSPEGHNCTYGSASLSTSYTYGALLCYGPDPAVYDIYSIQSGLSLLRVWESNEEIREELARRKPREFLDLWEEVGGNFSAQVRLILPPDMDKSGNTTYPLLVYVYAGPDYNLVTTEFEILFNDYLTSSRGIITALIDGRGSGNNGRRFLNSVYRRMGTVEIYDQINVTRRLVQNYSFVDADRVAIWGWSYGGFATAHALAKDLGDDQVFCCGISVAPVTSFIYYDTIYTERYMGLPIAEDNLEGYNGTDVTRIVDNIRNKKFLLLHGNADDNVHYQNSMALSRALEEKQIMFQQQSYPDEAHSLSTVLPHVYHTMDDFWTRAFHLPKPSWQD